MLSQTRLCSHGHFIAYGDGPEKLFFSHSEGIVMEGFCQPEQLPSALSRRVV